MTNEVLGNKNVTIHCIFNKTTNEQPAACTAIQYLDSEIQTTWRLHIKPEVLTTAWVEFLNSTDF